MRLNKKTRSALLLVLGIAFIQGACADENPSPSDPNNTQDDGDGDGDGSPSSGGNNEGGSGNDDQGSGGELGQVPDDRADCSVAAEGQGETIGDCWDLNDCNGTTAVQFLNQCQGEGTCVGHFDNVARIEGFN